MNEQHSPNSMYSEESFRSLSSETSFNRPDSDAGSYRSSLQEDPDFILLDGSTLERFDSPETLQRTNDRTLTPSTAFKRISYLSALRPLNRTTNGISDRVLTLGSVLAINYFLTCGGPSGIEPIATAGGPMLGILVLLVYPLVFSVPFACVVVELCTAFPDDGGFVLWTNKAFGPFWGFQQGYWAWVTNVFGAAVYPIAIYSALTNVYGQFASPVGAYLIKTAITIALALPTLFGARIVSRTCQLLLLLVVAPFVVFSLWSFTEAKHFEYLGQVRHENVTFIDKQTHQQGVVEELSIDWELLLTTAFWSYDSIYLVSLFGGKVENPSYIYPRAIFGSLLFTTASYVIPTMAITALGLQHWSQFDTNSFETVARVFGGPVIQSMVMVSSICSNIGLFTADTFCGSHQLSGMAQCGLLPQAFARRHYALATPYISLLANTVPVLTLLAFDFNSLLNASNAISAFVQIMIILTAIKLRMTHADIHRPTKVPGGIVTFLAFISVPMIVLLFIIYSTLKQVVAGIALGVIVVVGLALGIAQFCFSERDPSGELPPSAFAQLFQRAGSREMSPSAFSEAHTASF